MEKLTLNQIKQKKWTKKTAYHFFSDSTRSGVITITNENETNGLNYVHEMFFDYDEFSGKYAINDEGAPFDADKSNFIVVNNDREYRSDSFPNVLPAEFTSFEVSEIPIKCRFDVCFDGEILESFTSLSDAYKACERIKNDEHTKISYEITHKFEQIAQTETDSEIELLKKEILDLYDGLSDFHPYVVDQNGYERRRW